MREVLVHLNVTAADDDKRSADEIADALLEAFHGKASFVSSTEHGVFIDGLDICCPLAEEVAPA